MTTKNRTQAKTTCLLVKLPLVSFYPQWEVINTSFLKAVISASLAEAPTHCCSARAIYRVPHRLDITCTVMAF